MPAAPGASLGEGEAPLEASQHVQGLSPATVYHYRVVVVSELHAGGAQVFTGPDQTFTTEPGGSGLVLPDGRAWELVSPPNKHGAQLAGIEGLGAIQASASGNAITYIATRPPAEGALGYSEDAQVLASDCEGGWSSQDISLAHASAAGVGAGSLAEYPLFSADLSAGLAESIGENFSSQAPNVFPPDTERTPYIHHNTICGADALEPFQPLVLGCPPLGKACPPAVEENADVPAGTKFGGEPTETKGPVTFAGASPDLAHVVVSSSVALKSPPHGGETTQEGLYEWSSDESGQEALQLVSVLPDGKLAPGTAKLGWEGFIARGAVSHDGSRVIWSEDGVSGQHLYLRDVNGGGRTLQLDVPESGCEGCGQAPAPMFQFASSDGSRIFFTDSQRLTNDAGEVPGESDLYVCEVEETGGKLSCSLSDLTGIAPGSGEGAEVQGAILGASEDGSWVYFVANGVLATGASQGACHENTAPAGATCNLYVEHRGTTAWEAPKLVAVLGGEDWPDWKGESTGGLDSQTARVTSDGRFLAFMSDRSLTGYENRDASTARPDEEVFEYVREADGGAGRVLCASCNPTGARPAGVEFAKLEKEGLAGFAGTGLWADDQGIAASVPAWVGYGLKLARYQPRYLTEEGRLFFDSSDALVPQDINGKEDVYEWEPAGVGSCASGSETYNAGSEGCVDLLSSGTASGESGFLDASDSGDDVFFLTNERLVKEDVDTATDLYDAHVCSATAPCSSAVESPPECTSADACRGPVSQQPGIFGAPATAVSSGTGNLPPAAPAPPAKPKPAQTTQQKLAAALKACRKAKNRHRRATCERQAHKRFPVKRKAKKQSSAGTGAGTRR